MKNNSKINIFALSIILYSFRLHSSNSTNHHKVTWEGKSPGIQKLQSEHSSEQKHALQPLHRSHQNIPPHLQKLFKTYLRLSKEFKKYEKEKINEWWKGRPTYSRNNTKTELIVLENLRTWAYFANYCLQIPYNQIKTEEDHRSIQDLQSFQDEAKKLTEFYTWCTSVKHKHYCQRANFIQKWYDSAQEIKEEEKDERTDIVVFKCIKTMRRKSNSKN